jgi:hypothetical protein
VDHPRGPHGDLAEGRRRIEGERLQEVTWISHGGGI